MLSTISSGQWTSSGADGTSRDSWLSTVIIHIITLIWSAQFSGHAVGPELQAPDSWAHHRATLLQPPKNIFYH
jgi:hypothetical protein